jgi:hypothetical protein
MGQFSDSTICDLFLMLFFLSRTDPVAEMGIVYESFQKGQLSDILFFLKKRLFRFFRLFPKTRHY